MPRHGQRKGSLGPPPPPPPPPEGPSSPAAAYPRGREPSVTSVTSAGGGAALTDEFSVATVIGLKHMVSKSSLAPVTPTEKLKGEKARSLLRMLLRSQKTSEDSFASSDIHNLIPCGDVVGLMAVIVKQCKDFTPKFTVNRDTHLLVRISIDKIMKCTNPQVFKANKNSRKPITINFGDVRYFSVKVPKQKSDPRNRITLELVGFEGPKDFPRLFGNVTMHLYDVIQKQSFTEICAMRIRNMVFCTVEVEFMFCYGCLGYGYSHQLKLPGTDPAQAVAYSMFLRVPPPEERKDHSSNVIKPQHMDYPAFLSPDLNVTIANVELDPPAEISEHYQSLQKALKEPPRERLERMKKEYRSLPTWPEKAEYLDQLILKKGPKTGTSQPKMSRFREIVGKIHMPGHKVAPSIVVGVVEEEKIPDIPPDEVQPDELQPDEMQSDEMQPDGMQADEIQLDENQPDKIQTDELQPDEMQPDGMQADEIQPDRIQPDEIQPDEIQTDELQPNEMQPPEILEWASVPHDVSNLYFQPRELEPSGEELESEGELVGVTNFLNGSTETTQLIPTLAVTSSTTYPSRSSSGDVVEDKVRRRKFSHESETSLSSSSEVPAEFSETGDSESFIFAGPMGQEELPATVKKPATIEYMPEPIQSKESLPRSDIPLPVLDKCVTPKSSESVVKSEQKWLLKDNGFQKAVFSGSKFEPFLRRVCKVQPPPLSIGKTDIFSQLEETPDDMKEVEDQDPPHGVPFTKKDSNLDTNRSGEQLSILRLIERKMGLEEEGQNIATQTEEPTSLGITSSIPKKSLRNKLSEAEIKQAQMSLKDSLEEFLVDKLVKVSVLESVLSKNLENLVAERLSREREDSDSEKQSPEERKASSREKFSEPDIETLKEVSQNLQTRLVGKLSQQGIIPDMKVAEKDQKVYFPSATDLLKRGESLSKERITQNEIVTIKPLSDSHSGDISEIEQDVKETGLSASRHEDDREPTWPFKIQDSLIKRALSKADLKKEPSTQSLEIIRITVPLSTETDSNNQQLSNYDILLEKVLKAEITSLKSFLSKNLQDHLKDKLAEIGVTPKDLKTVCSKLSFTRKGKHMMTPEEVLQEDQVPSDEDLVEETPVLSESVQNILQALSKRELTNLKSALNKKIQDHILERLAEIGLITEEELREILENLLPVVAKETSPTGIKESELLKEEQTTPPLTQNLHERFSEEELQNLKSLLSKLLKEGHRDALSESEVKGLTSVLQKSCEDLPIQSSSKSEIKEGVEIKDKSCKISSTNAEDELKGSNVIVLERRKDHSKESLHKISALDEKYGIRRETVDLSVNGIFEVEKRNQETQTVLPRKRVKHSSKKESHRWPSSPNNPEMSDLKKGLCEAELKSKSSDEILKTVSEPFTSSSFLSAHDIGVQTVLRNYLTKPNYPAKPSFPVNPQTFILLHSESEDEAKTSCKYHQKPHSKRKYERKRDLVSHHSHQAGTNAQTKKEKSSSGSSSKEVLKEKGKRHGEPSPSRPIMTEYRKDLKTTASPSNMRKESQKLKEERKRENEVKSKKATHKTAALSDPHLSKNLPASERTKGNTLVPAGTDDINMEAFKHLEKAIERALLDLGRIPDSSSLQGRPNTAPTAAALMSSDSSRSFTSLIGAPRNQAGSITEMLYNQEQILKMTPEQLEIVLRILQNILRQNTRPQNNE